ncbi:MAG: hypothetical protein A4E49_01744 [Methanosaeta sp. PtaU1.Bin112]|nr:MAG: hypothetical protein A4E49_01744 [Methanosaeta sp. PtaU1.Bin112]
MDVSFSAWRHSREECLQLKGEGFSFLFDRRYTNRLNRMSRVFFEAYVVATKELAAQEDRFPSLSEIDAKMESGAVYAFKDRLMKNTEFFEEVKISGVSYLVPRALRFVDVTGTYTDLILNFDEGTVTMPTRRKMAPIPDSTVPVVESGPVTPRAVEDAEEIPSIAEDQTEEKTEETAGSKPQNETKGKTELKAEDEVEEAKPPSYPLHEPEVFEEISPAPDASDVAPSSASPARNIAAGSFPAKEILTAPMAKKKMEMPPRTVTLLGSAFLLALLAVLFMYGPALVDKPVPPTSLVYYSANLSNSSNESYLALNITNPDEMANDMQISLPPNIDQSISARGGIVTISHGNNTLVRMNSTGDASVKIYLQGNWTTIPVSLSFQAPEGFNTNLLVYGLPSTVTSRNETSVLEFNLTQEGVSFEQSYTQKK